MAMCLVSRSHHRPVAPHSVMLSEHMMPLSEAALPWATPLAGMSRLPAAEQPMAVSSVHMCGRVRAARRSARPWGSMCGLVQAEVLLASSMAHMCRLVQVVVLWVCEELQCL